MFDTEVWRAWLAARIELARRSQGGFTAVEWMFIALGVLAVAGIAVAAVRAYVNDAVSQLNG